MSPLIVMTKFQDKYSKILYIKSLRSVNKFGYFRLDDKGGFIIYIKDRKGKIIWVLIK